MDHGSADVGKGGGPTAAHQTGPTTSKWQIFILGTNNWQGGGEFAPGSGILHEGHHDAFRALPSVAGCYSMWPSSKQRSDPSSRPDYRVFSLTHGIPICESVSPVSNYRWHSMSDDEFTAYRQRLIDEVEKYISEVESQTGVDFNLFIAHHCFVNPTVMVEINAKRVKLGRPRVPVVVFAHGTSLKMYLNEKNCVDEYPQRFFRWITAMQTFNNQNNVDLIFAISKAQQEVFTSLFQDYPRGSVVVAPNGYNQRVFRPIEGATAEQVLKHLPPQYFTDLENQLSPTAAKFIQVAKAEGIPFKDFNRFVVFTGKFADWKRIDVVLLASKIYRASALQKCGGVSIATLIVGGGPEADEKRYKSMAFIELQLHEHVFFLGPQSQDVLARINTIADIGLYPSKDEPFGLVFVECMACGTPTLGANSGGPVDFVRPDVGALIDESDDKNVLAARFAAAVEAAVVDGNWKAEKGPRCIQYAVEHFSLLAQCQKMLQSVEHHHPCRIKPV